MPNTTYLLICIAKKIVLRYPGLSSVMVCSAVSKTGPLPLLFIDTVVKVNKESYLYTVLINHVIPETQKLYGEPKFVFQQDSAPDLAANIVQTRCQSNFPDFTVATLFFGLESTGLL